MHEKIEKLRDKLDQLEEDYENLLTKLYKAQPHKTFKPGDWVKGERGVGIVGWVENSYLNLKEEDGFFGLDIKNGDLGFCAPLRRDDYELLSQEELEYYTMHREITIYLTGEDIEDLYYRIGRSNGSKATKKLFDALKQIYKG